MGKKMIDLTELDWQLYGTIPYAWLNSVSMEIGVVIDPEIGPLPLTIPSSVQKVLMDADIIPDWNYDINFRNCDWVENKHWIFTCNLPLNMLEEKGYSLVCEGLDYSGWIYFNSTLIGEFANSFVEHTFSIDKTLIRSDNRINIIFKEPPRWLGQIGYTSKVKEWKPRFNYTWDWIPRVVQQGITGKISLIPTDVPQLNLDKVDSSYDTVSQLGQLLLETSIDNSYTLAKETLLLKAAIYDAHRNLIESVEGKFSQAGEANLALNRLKVDPWFPNGYGEQPLYSLETTVVDQNGTILWKDVKSVGFKEVVWESCQGAPQGATKWICKVNGVPLFLQGVNWTPISPTFADVTPQDIRKRLKLYKEMGCNLFRVWGGAVLESTPFYSICDEYGLMVWQDLPLSSSGIDNWPPEEKAIIEDISEIAISYIKRRMSHVSLLMYSGGNELQGSLDGSKEGTGKPIDFNHPMMDQLKKVFEKYDGRRRFIPTSPLGPRFKADQEEFGKGVHWSTHGPWNVDGVLDERWQNYWANDDSLLRAETGCPGTMNLVTLKKYLPNLDVWPIDNANPVWGRTSWWTESDVFFEQFKREPEGPEEYFKWSENRQAEALRVSVTETKKRFPASGGIIIWMGHDCYPCAANTSVIDFECQPKPAYFVLKEIFNSSVEELNGN